MTRNSSGFSDTSQMEAQDLYDHAVHILTTRSTAGHYSLKFSTPDAIPSDVITLLKSAIEQESQKALRLMIHLILHCRTEIEGYEKINYLRMGARESREAAYQLARASIGKGRFAQFWDDEVPGWHYFYYAALQRHPTAYDELLDAMCKDELVVPPEKFIQLSKSIVKETKDRSVAVLLGGLCCGMAPIGWERLTELIPEDPDEGFDYLVFAAYSGPKDKNALNAQGILDESILKKKFSSALADRTKHIKVKRIHPEEVARESLKFTS